MSGTSLDGLDVALCQLRGSGLRTKLSLLHFKTIPYTAAIKARIAAVFAKPQVDFVKLSHLHPFIGTLHGNMVRQCLRQWKIKPSAITAIASHGQTVMHAPAHLHPADPVNSTFQIGDGDHVAMATGILTVSDFRQKHIAAGGEGAPLAVYGDYLLLAHKKENRLLLNIGGIANFTFLPAGQNATRVFVTDTGPGNTLLDQAVRHYFPGRYFDAEAAGARQGRVNQPLLTALKAHPFFSLPFPKTTGPELFNLDYLHRAQIETKTTDLSVYDVLATLTRFSAETVVEAIQRAVKKQKFDIYLSGGGAHNPLLTQWIREGLRVPALPTTDVLGIPGDAKEAILFAVLANETLHGKPINFGKRTKIPSVTMGKISLPY
ncbi:MAG: anhydro-N-acetylmuramic acid kinase [Cyclobacteriaceae bacterium]|nr:anhydro-N-acetylmuramic acid kinase [Cyclobacteriaceae bacterium]